MQKQGRALVPFGSEPGVPVVAAAELESAAAVLAENAKAPNTRRAYESDWASWEEFCRAHDFVPLPADPEQVTLYLTQLTTVAGRKRKSSGRARRSVISRRSPQLIAPWDSPSTVTIPRSRPNPRRHPA
jgi:hypothetical protein